jgi:hypothetical protein
VATWRDGVVRVASQKTVFPAPSRERRPWPASAACQCASAALASRTEGWTEMARVTWRCSRSCPDRSASVNDPPRARSGLRLPRQCAQAGGAEKAHAAQVRVNVQDTAGGKLDPTARGAAVPV